MKHWLMIGLVAVVALTGVMTACTATPKKTAPPVATIKIEATTTTWREGKQPHDIYGTIKEKLEETGFEVVPVESTVYDAILLVDYTEDRGALYGRQYQPATEWGTRITCHLGLVDNTQTLIFYKRIDASTPPEAGELYWAALEDLWDQAYFMHLGAIIASKFGVGDEVSVLIDTLQDSDSDSYTRVKAIVVLGETGDPRVIEPLILALEDTDSSVRMAAAGALGQTGDERALDPLIHAWVNDKDTRVQDVAEAASYWLRSSLK